MRRQLLKRYPINGRLLKIAFIITLSACVVHKHIEYNIPEDITGEKREELLQTLDKGRQLYQLYCAKCHGIFSTGIDNAPNFTDKQVDLYTAYAIKGDPSNHAAAANMSPEQLHEVFMFLKARKIKHPAGTEPAGKVVSDTAK